MGSSVVWLVVLFVTGEDNKVDVLLVSVVVFVVTAGDVVVVVDFMVEKLKLFVYSF